MTALHFSRPELLWLLPLAALPLLVHLLNRRRVRRQPFAAMDFLLRVQRLSRRRLLLRQLLLLLLRTLVLAGLVLAAAGPRLASATASGTASRRLTAVVLDRSLSMRARQGEYSWFELARRRAARHLERAGGNERVCLLGAGLSDEVLLSPCSDRPALLLERLRKLQPQWGSSNLVRAARKAAELLRRQQAGAGWQLGVVLVTDGAAHALAGAAGPAWPAGVSMEIEVVGASGSRDNLALAEATARPAGAAVAVNVQLRSHAERDLDNVRLTVSQLPEHRLLASGFAGVSAGGLANKRFTLGAVEQPRLVAVELAAGDPLAADDLRLLWLPGRAANRLLLVDGAGARGSLADELYFLEHVLQAAGGGLLDYRVVTPERLVPAGLAEYQAVVLANVPGLDAVTAAALQSFVAAGGGLLVAVGDNLDVERDNHLLGPLLPCPLRDVVALGPQEGEQRGLGLSAVDAEHPVLQAFSGEERGALSRVHAWRAAALEPGRSGAEFRVLLEYTNGMPALVEKSLGRGRVLLLTTSLDRDWNNWPTRASYLPFFQRLMAYLAGNLERPSPPRVEVGAPLALPWEQGLERLLVRGPNGREYRLQAGPAARQVIFRDTTRPGWWSLQAVAAAGTQVRYPLEGFFVDPPAAESDLHLCARELLEKRLGVTALWRDGTEPGRRSNELEWLLLLVVAGCVAAECFLVRK